MSEKNYRLPETWTSARLLSTVFPEPSWIIPAIIPEGLSLIAGSPKIGKSWLCLNLVSALAVGGYALGKIKVPKIKCLYAALEDSPRRLQSRLDTIGALPDPDTAFYSTTWARGNDCINLIKLWLTENPDTKCFVFDTLARISPRGFNGNDYNETSEFLAELQSIATEKHLAIILITHARKGSAEISDFIEGIIGSQGQGGTADTIITISRGRGEADALLHITGRDVEEQTLALQFNSNVGSWTILGDASDIQKTKERQEIVDYLRENEGAKTSQIAKELGKQDSAVSNLLRKLKSEGIVYSPKYGVWAIRNTDESSVSSESTYNDESKLTPHSSLSPPFTECKIDNFSRDDTPEESEDELMLF